MMLSLPTPAPDRPWVLGIRPKTTEWHRRVQSLLLSTFIDDAPGAATAAAEAGLGLPACAYWYVFRSEEHFGHIVFLWTEAVALRPSDGAVAPFDTGGVWHDHVKTDPALDAASKKKLVSAHSQPVSEWLRAFQLWISGKYDDEGDYVRGAPPRAGVPGIVYDSRNQAPAWTWEARLDKAAYRKQVTIRNVFWSADDRKAFEDWVESAGSGLDEKVADDLLELVDRTSIVTPRTERTHEEVVRHLLRMI